jgi:hypothetical protein
MIESQTKESDYTRVRKYKSKLRQERLKDITDDSFYLG